MQIVETIDYTSPTFHLCITRDTADNATATQDAVIQSHGVEVKNAVRKAKAEEHIHHSRVLKAEKEKTSRMQSLINHHEKRTTDLLNQTIAANMTKQTAGRDVRTSTKRARVLNELTGKQETELERMKKKNKKRRMQLRRFN